MSEEDPASDLNAETSEFAAVPPEITTTDGDGGLDRVFFISIENSS